MSEELQEYEQSNRTKQGFLYSYKDVIPLWVWEVLPGISPQKQRSYALQAKYLMPLDFSYGFLQLYRQIAFFGLLNYVFKYLWNTYFLRYRLLIVFLFICSAIIIVTFHWAQRKNTATIKEEIFFHNTLTFIAFIISLMIINTDKILPILHKV